MQVDFPEFPRAKVFIGGCVKRGEGSSFRASAHAHTSSSQYQGWICVRSKKPETLRLPDGTPSNLMKHEYAHILTLEGHTRRFWETLAKIGGFMERESYFGHKKETFIKMRVPWSEVADKVRADQLEFISERY